MALFNAPGGTGSTGLKGDTGPQGLTGPAGQDVSIKQFPFYSTSGLVLIPMSTGRLLFTTQDGSLAYLGVIS